MNAKKHFYDYLELTKDTMKPKTFDTHDRFTRHILNALDSIGITELEQINLEAGYKILTYYKNHTTNGNNSINKNLRYLKVVMKHYEVFTSIHRLPSLKQDSEPFRRFSHDELKQIIKYCKKLDLSKNSLVYRTFIYLALDSGMRKQELLNVQIRNIDFDKKVIYLEDTKNGFPRLAPFSSFSESCIKELIKVKTRRKYLFYNRLKKRQLSSNDIRLFYRRMRMDLGLDRIHTHRFRKTFASILADNGMPLQYIQKLLDHKSVKTTMVYIQYDSLKPLEEYKKYNKWHVRK